MAQAMMNMLAGGAPTINGAYMIDDTGAPILAQARSATTPERESIELDDPVPAAMPAAADNNKPTLEELKQKFYRGLTGLFDSSQYGADSWLSDKEKQTILMVRAQARQDLNEALAAMRDNPGLAQEAIKAGEAYFAQNGLEQRNLKPLMDSTVGLALRGDPKNLTEAMALGAGLQELRKTPDATLMLMAALANSGDTGGVVN